MPCPPSYEEMRMMSLDRDVDNVWHNLQRQFAEIVNTLIVIAAIDLQPCSDEQRGQITSLEFALQALNPEGLKTELAMEDPTHWPCLEEVDRYEQYLAVLTKIDQTAELRLCETRTFLYVNGPQIIPEKTWLGSDFAEKWRLEVERHALHREADRTAVIATRQRDVVHFQGRLASELSPTQRESATSILAERLQEIQLIQSVPIETLMAKRDAIPYW